jgi:hypothetical protein
MKPIFLNLSRRNFLTYLGITSASVIVKPSTLIAKTTTSELTIFVVNTDLTVTSKFSKNQQITLVNSSEEADIIFLNGLTETSQSTLQEYINQGKIFMINQPKQEMFLFSMCQKAGVLFASVKFSNDATKLFDSVDYFEPKTSQTIHLQKVISVLNFLVSNTQHHQFKIFSVTSFENTIS